MLLTREDGKGSNHSCHGSSIKELKETSNIRLNEGKEDGIYLSIRLLSFSILNLIENRDERKTLILFQDGRNLLCVIELSSPSSSFSLDNLGR